MDVAIRFVEALDADASAADADPDLLPVRPDTVIRSVSGADTGFADG